MSAPVASGVWFAQVNAPFPATDTAANINISLLFMLKEMLKGTSTSGSTGSFSRPTGSLWTVEGSCDSLTGAMDGVDRLTGSAANSFNSASWVRAASGSAHSWIVLKSPPQLGPVWMCIDENSTTSTTVGVIFSRQAFTGSIPSGIPTQITSSRPITNNAWALGTTVDPVQTTNAVMLSDQTVGTWRAHILVDASGAFHFMTNRNQTGVFNFWMTCFNAADRVSGDNSFPTFCSKDNNSSAKGAPLWTNVAGASTGCTGRVMDGSTTMSVGGFSSWAFGATNFSSTVGPDTSGSSFTGSFRALPPYIQCLVGNKNSWRGRMPDAWVIGTPNPGDAFPTTGSQTHIVVGDLILPCQLSASL